MWGLVAAFFACGFLIDWLERRGRFALAMSLCFPVALVIVACLLSKFFYA